MRLIDSLKGKFYRKKESLRDRILFKKKAEYMLSHASAKKIIILCNDCTAGLIMHDFKLPCYTPTVNNCIPAHQFIEFCKRPEYYCTLELEESDDHSQGCPAGRLDDVTVYFGHSATFEEARKEWKKGCRRFLKALEKKHEICVITNDRNGWDDSLDSEFEALPYTYKMCFSHKENGKSTYFIREDKGKESVGVMTDWSGRLSLHRRYDKFDFFSWFLEMYKD